MTTTNIDTFTIGSSYFMRSACDHNAVWTYIVASRTAKRMKIQEKGKTAIITVGIQVYENVERCSPLGKYSMSPVLSADRKVA